MNSSAIRPKGIAEKKAKAGDYRGAVTLYEASLDGTAQTAEVHYRLAVIYDEKLRSPLDALHPRVAPKTLQCSSAVEQHSTVQYRTIQVR